MASPERTAEQIIPTEKIIGDLEVSAANLELYAGYQDDGSGVERSMLTAVTHIRRAEDRLKELEDQVDKIVQQQEQAQNVVRAHPIILKTLEKFTNGTYQPSFETRDMIELVRAGYITVRAGQLELTGENQNQTTPESGL